MKRLLELMILAALLCINPRSLWAIFQTTDEALAAMNAARDQHRNALDCLQKTDAEKKRIVEEKDGLEKANKEVSETYKAVQKEMDAVLFDFARGFFCSQCNRSSHEIEKTGESFFIHLARVNGRIVLASPEQVANKQIEYQNRLNALSGQYKQNESRLLQLVAEQPKLRIRGFRCEGESNSSREKYLRAKYWYEALRIGPNGQARRKNALPKPLTAAQFGLGSNVRTSEYMATRAYYSNYGVATLGPEEALNPPDPQDIVRIATHRGIDFSSIEGERPFKAGFAGKAWVQPGSDYNTINVLDPRTGNLFQFLHASKSLLSPELCRPQSPCSISANTDVGITGSTGADKRHLHLQVKRGDEYISPDSAFILPNSPFFAIEGNVIRDMSQATPSSPLD